MNSNKSLTMWSSSNIDLTNMNLVVDHQTLRKVVFEPSPYTFTTVENGKKTVIDAHTITPPRWLLLDHTIAVVWAMFSLNPYLQQLSTDDMKWAHEFLKNVRNKKGDNPPDVKICLKEIQDRLINLYASLTALKEADFDEIAAAFGDKIQANPSSNSFATRIVSPRMWTSKVESKSSISSSVCQSKNVVQNQFPLLYNRHSSKDVSVTKQTEDCITNATHKKLAIQTYSKKPIPVTNKGLDVFEGQDSLEDDEVEKYLLSIFEDEKKESQEKSSIKSLIPTKRKPGATISLSEMISSEKSTKEIKKKERKTSKKVHCVAEMRSLRVQKSMKVEETNVSLKGEEAAYSNLKAEIRRLTINPNVSKPEVKKFLKEWRSEQMERLNNELKRLNSIEEFLKSVETCGDEISESIPKTTPVGKQRNQFSHNKNYFL